MEEPCVEDASKRGIVLLRFEQLLKAVPSNCIEKVYCHITEVVIIVSIGPNI